MKERIDILLVERRLVESRTKAQWLIRKGYVIVNGIVITKPGKKVDNSFDLQLKRKFPYVGRGGLKLEAALDEFSICVEDRICADIGASIGGFTDCLLQRGAKRIYSIDIASDRLHPSLMCEKMKDKVIPFLGVDARQKIFIDEKIDICTIDVTFSSLKSILPNTKNFLKKDGDIIALVKPFFESDLKKTVKFRIVQDSAFHNKILVDLIGWCIENHFNLLGIIRTPVLDIESSTEFFIHLRTDRQKDTFNIEEKIKSLLNNAFK
ncbi:MAG: TlyA family RNA methyltransferase [Promethearchaeota archaeon]|jgi:23S rRNA (cytidine1920-2'-O)/16S rRNA (cytidine1409-2'-O)-methyltransferase